MDRLKDKPTRKDKETARKPLKKPLAGINHLERIMGVEPVFNGFAIALMDYVLSIVLSSLL